MELKPAFSKLKGSRGLSLFFFFCEQAEDGKPALVLDNKKIGPKVFKPVLDTAKKKTKCFGRFEMNDDGELLVTPTGSFPATLAKGIQIAARNANTMVFNGIVIKPAAPEEEEDEDEADGAIPVAPPQPQNGNGASPKTEAKTATADDARFNARLKEFLPKVLAAQKAGAPAAEALKLGVSQAQLFGRKNDYAQANALLDRLEKLAEKPAPQSDAGAEEVPVAPPPQANGTKEVSNVVFQQSRLLWDGTRKRVQSELDKLKAGVAKMCEQINNDPEGEVEVDLDDLAVNIDEVDRVLEGLDERLLDKLDEALNAKTPELRKAKHQEAKAIIKDYTKYLVGDPLLATIDKNGFVNIEIRKTVGAVLQGLAAKL